MPGSGGIFGAGVAVGAVIGSLLTYVWTQVSEVEIVDLPVTDEECKMVLVVRKDLPMTKGKVAAQCAHAAVACVETAASRAPDTLKAWKAGGQAKITLQCDNLSELQRLQTRAVRLGVVARPIADAGRTQIDPGSITVLGVGPAPVKLVNEITGHLKLF